MSPLIGSNKRSGTFNQNFWIVRPFLQEAIGY